MPYLAAAEVLTRQILRAKWTCPCQVNLTGVLDPPVLCCSTRSKRMRANGLFPSRVDPSILLLYSTGSSWTRSVSDVRVSLGVSTALGGNESISGCLCHCNVCLFSFAWASRLRFRQVHFRRKIFVLDTQDVYTRPTLPAQKQFEDEENRP